MSGAGSYVRSRCPAGVVPCIEDAGIEVDREIPASIERLFESVDTPLEDTGVGPAPPETVALWVKLIATMGPNELADFEARTFKQWDCASLGDPGRAVERRGANRGITHHESERHAC